MEKKKKKKRAENEDSLRKSIRDFEEKEIKIRKKNYNIDVFDILYTSILIFFV
jgi:hypothetical protein